LKHQDKELKPKELSLTNIPRHYISLQALFLKMQKICVQVLQKKDKNLYSRFSNPNVTEFVDKIAKMEGAESGYAFATGMAAIYSTFATLLNAGDHIVSCQSVFGSTHTLFTKYFQNGISKHLISKQKMLKM
jgi:O-succinylhomoserine sulfhydrylase